MSTIGLTMIVRDAEKTLPRLLASLPEDTDPERSTVIDTGSRDNTRDIVRNWGVEPINATWHNFAVNRTALMDKARGKADYLLLLDADMELEWDAPLEPLTADICMASVITGDYEHPLPVLVRGDRRWEYRGAAHAALVSPDFEQMPCQKLTSFVIRDHGTTDRSKYIRDIDALWDELRASQFTDARAWFYLGQSYRDLGETEQALACFTTRSTMGGMEEERWAAMYLSGCILIERNFPAGAALLLQAFQQRPTRAEPLRVLAAFADSVADAMPVPEGEVLPLRREFYGPRASEP